MFETGTRIHVTVKSASPMAKYFPNGFDALVLEGIGETLREGEFRMQMEEKEWNKLTKSQQEMIGDQWDVTVYEQQVYYEFTVIEVSDTKPVETFVGPVCPCCGNSGRYTGSPLLCDYCGFDIYNGDVDAYKARRSAKLGLDVKHLNDVITIGEAVEMFDITPIGARKACERASHKGDMWCRKSAGTWLMLKSDAARQWASKDRKGAEK
jgi:hypothetical protein